MYSWGKEGYKEVESEQSMTHTITQAVPEAAKAAVAVGDAKSSAESRKAV